MKIIKGKKPIEKIEIKEDITSNQPTTFNYSFAEISNDKYPVVLDSNTIVSDLQGFPEIMQEQLGVAGGKAVERKDFNSSFNYVFNYLKYKSQGGMPQFSQEIVNAGGYEQGSVVLNTSKKSFLINLVNNNTSETENWFQLSYKDIIDIDGNITFNGNTITTGNATFNLITSTNKAEFVNRPYQLNITDKNNRWATLGDTDAITSNSVFNKKFISTASFTYYFNKNLSKYDKMASTTTGKSIYINSQYPSSFGNINLQNSVIVKGFNSNSAIDFLDYNSSYNSNTIYATFTAPIVKNIIYNINSNSCWENNLTSISYTSNYINYYKDNKNGILKNLYFSLKITIKNDNYSIPSSSMRNTLCINYDNFSMKETPISIGYSYNSKNKLSLGNNSNGSVFNAVLKSPVIQCFDTITNSNFYLIANSYRVSDNVYVGFVKTYDFITYKKLVVKTSTTEIQWIDINTSVPSGFSTIELGYNLFLNKDNFKGMFIASNTYWSFNTDMSIASLVPNLGSSYIRLTNNALNDDSFIYSRSQYFNLDEREYNYSIDKYMEMDLLTKNVPNFKIIDNKYYYSKNVKNANNNYDIVFIDENLNMTTTNLSGSSQAVLKGIFQFYKVNDIIYSLNNTLSDIYINNVLVPQTSGLIYSADGITWNHCDLSSFYIGTKLFCMYQFKNKVILNNNNSQLMAYTNSSLYPTNIFNILTTDAQTDIVYQFQNTNNITNINYIKPIYTNDFITFEFCNIDNFENDFGTSSNLSAAQKTRLNFIYFSNKNDDNVFLVISTYYNDTPTTGSKSITYKTIDGINYIKVDEKGFPIITNQSKIISTIIHFANNKYFKYYFVTNSQELYMQISDDGINWVDTDLMTSHWDLSGITRFNVGVYMNGIVFFDGFYYTNVFETKKELANSGLTVYITYTKTYKSSNGINWDLCNIQSNKSGNISATGYATQYTADDANNIVSTNLNCYLPLLTYDTV